MNILHKDEHILVVDKPAGISVLPEGWDREAVYLLQMLEADHGKIWVVHRLDKTTSGVMVFARNAEAHRSLNIQFEKHEVEKLYRGITVGVPGWEQKTAKHPLRVNVGHKHRTMVDDRNGVRAETRFNVLKRHPSSALIEAQPMTGRTHQIRVHLYALGYPLLGDSLYSAPSTDLIARPALHAFSLSFQHPVSNERISFQAPNPADFQSALTALKSRSF
jgi:RluA family pseudouridine synthase